jgi:AcrR family transcriptional regulator
VNLALINRYFGTKEQLFLETMQVPTFESLFGDDPTKMAEHAAHYASRYEASGPNQEQLLALLRSSQNETAARVMRESLRRHGQPLAEALGDEEGELRTEMALAVLMGVAIFQRFLHTDRLSQISPDQLETLLIPVLKACLPGR